MQYKKIWNKCKCRDKYKELIDNFASDKEFMWRASSKCDYDCDKLCNVENIYIMKIVKVEKKLINYIPNALKISINLSCLK